MHYEEIEINGSTYYLGEDGWVYVMIEGNFIWYAYSISEVENEK